MKRLLFTFPEDIARSLKENVPSGQRSKFVVHYIKIPLKKLGKKSKRKSKAKQLYKASFLKDIAKARCQIARGELYTQEQIMKEFGVL